MTETTSRNDYGCDDSMDGAYNILKLTVSDKNEHMLIPNNTSSPLEIQKHTKVHEDTSQMASSVSNIVKTKNHESKPLIHREKKKHQKELLRALDEFKQGSTKERKKLRKIQEKKCADILHIFLCRIVCFNRFLFFSGPHIYGWDRQRTRHIRCLNHPYVSASFSSIVWFI
uniref:Uncharacterized protein n=1 Tax=Magallana gigas TaxID=29159 RepID=A0A8W8ITT3_MAGGI